MLSELRTMWEVLKHTFTKAETVQYPEEMPYLSPPLSRPDCADSRS